MANQNEVLRALLTKEEAAAPATLASELKADEATVRTYLNRLKKKGYVDGGGSQWYINDAGRAALESGYGAPITKEDVGEDELSKFRYYGDLSGVPPDKVIACIELFQNTNMRSMDEMARILAEINIPQPQQNQWKSLYRGYLRNTTPAEQREELYPLPKPEEVAASEEGLAAAGEARKGESLDYIVEDNNILQVGAGLGMFTFRQALQVMAAKRGTGPPTQGGTGSLKDLAEAVGILNPNQPLTLADVITINNMISEARGGGGDPPPPPIGYYVDNEGNVQELKPGQPIVVKKVTQEPSKTYFLNPNSGLLEENEPGKPIIIQMQPSPGSNVPAMVPFPAIGQDGQPVLDKEGKPVFVDIEPQLRWMGFQSEQRRAEERHGALMGLVKTARENIPDGIQAILAAASEFKGTKAKTPPASKAAEQPIVFQCADCPTQFSPPADWEGQPLKCPKCGREYTKEELLA